MVRQIKDPNTKLTIARKVLEALHDWFEVDESREKYISDSAYAAMRTQVLKHYLQI